MAMILAKFTSLEIGKALLASDFLIALAAGGLDGIKTGLYCVLGLLMKAFLVDSVTALLANEMFRPDGSFDPDAPRRVCADLLRFAAGAEHAVFVCDFILSDAGRYDGYTEAYRRGLADIGKALAAYCDTVAETCGGNYILCKGAMPW